VILPLSSDLSAQLLPDDRRFGVAGCSTAEYHVRVLFGGDVLGTFDDARFLYNDIRTLVVRIDVYSVHITQLSSSHLNRACRDWSQPRRTEPCAAQFRWNEVR